MNTTTTTLRPVVFPPHVLEQAANSPMKTRTFPWKLHEMLELAGQEGYDNIVSWLPDGRSFKVYTPNDFVKKVMPNFFLQSKYKSFQRQLNLWGFERLPYGPGKGGYFHPDYFVRDDRYQMCQMKRRKIAKRTVAATAAVTNANATANTSKGAGAGTGTGTAGGAGAAVSSSSFSSSSLSSSSSSTPTPKSVSLKKKKSSLAAAEAEATTNTTTESSSRKCFICVGRRF